MTIKMENVYLFVHSLNKENEYFAVEYYEKGKFFCTITFKNGVLESNNINIQRIAYNVPEESRKALGKSLYIIANSVLFFMEGYAEKTEYVTRKKVNKKLKKKTRTTYEYSISLDKLKEALVDTDKLMQINTVNFMPAVSDIDKNIINNLNLDLIKCDIKLKEELISYFENVITDKLESITGELLIDVVNGRDTCWYYYIRRIPCSEVIQIDIISKEEHYIESILLTNITEGRSWEDIVFKMKQIHQEDRDFTEEYAKEISSKVMYAVSCLIFYIQNKDKCYLTEEVTTSTDRKVNGRKYHDKSDANIKSRKVIYLPHTVGYIQKQSTTKKCEGSGTRICNYTTEEWTVRPYKQVRKRKDGTTYVVDITPKPRKRKKELLEESRKLFPSGKEFRITKIVE